MHPMAYTPSYLNLGSTVRSTLTLLSFLSSSHRSSWRSSVMGSEKNLFLAHILKYINDMAFKLDASVPFAPRGLFGRHGRKGIWVFKGSESWWPRSKWWLNFYFLF